MHSQISRYRSISALLAVLIAVSVIIGNPGLSAASAATVSTHSPSGHSQTLHRQHRSRFRLTVDKTRVRALGRKRERLVERQAAAEHNRFRHWRGEAEGYRRGFIKALHLQRMTAPAPQRQVASRQRHSRVTRWKPSRPLWAGESRGLRPGALLTPPASRSSSRTTKHTVLAVPFAMRNSLALTLQEGRVIERSTPACGQYPSGTTISTSVAWKTNCSPYVVSGTVTVTKGGRLTIQGGVTVETAGAAFQVQSGGVLNATGTVVSGATKAVTFTSAAGKPAPGDWGGIDYQPGSSGSISSASINYAGASMLNSYCGALYNNCGTNAALLIEEPSSVHVTNSTFGNIENNGVEVTGSGGAPVVTGDAFTYCSTCFKDSKGNPVPNGGAAVRFDFVPGHLATVTSKGTTPWLSGLSSFGFRYNGVDIVSGTYADTGVWPNPGIPYGFDNTITISGKLTVGGGSTLQMAERRAICCPKRWRAQGRRHRDHPHHLRRLHQCSVPSCSRRLGWHRLPTRQFRLHLLHLPRLCRRPDAQLPLWRPHNNCGTNAALLIEGANSPNVSVVHSHIENSAANGIEVTSEANPALRRHLRLLRQGRSSLPRQASHQWRHRPPVRLPAPDPGSGQRTGDDAATPTTPLESDPAPSRAAVRNDLGYLEERRGLRASANRERLRSIAQRPPHNCSQYHHSLCRRQHPDRRQEGPSPSAPGPARYDRHCHRRPRKRPAESLRQFPCPCDPHKCRREARSR